MLEKIGLPAKPSSRGSNWVVDASHCQGCSSQFTFINRKHHCRRCGGLFCNNCTLQRMVLRGQGDSPVRVCEPCKQLEEAARFEMHYGHRNRGGKGSSRSMTRKEDEIVDQVLGSDGKKSSSGQLPSTHRASSTSSCSTIQGRASFKEGEETRGGHSVDEPGSLLSEMGSTSPKELRQRALDEKKKYKVLKGEGKSEEALKAFKRGKELERQADALEISIRKNRKKVIALSNSLVEVDKKDGATESASKRKLIAQGSEEKDDLTAELRRLGWSDVDLHDEDKKQVHTSLNSELSSLFGDVSQTTNKGKEHTSKDNGQVVELKKRALVFKRQGKLLEAKEELKKAKILEKQLEEQEVLGMAEDSDYDDISAMIYSMDNENEDDHLSTKSHEGALDFDHSMVVDDIGIGDHMEVTDKDLMDPELTATLKSLGWNDDNDIAENVSADVIMEREELQREILSLKREALSLKQAGNAAEAMERLKKAKRLEKDIQNLYGSTDSKPMTIESSPTSQNNSTNSYLVTKHAPKSRVMIQKELLALKKKALALRREGRLDEAEEELKKGRVLEEQLAEVDNAPKLNAQQSNVGKDVDLAYEHPTISDNKQVDEEVEQDITDQDMHDPTYLSILRNLGWKDEDNELTDSILLPPSSVAKASLNMPARRPKRSKAEVQRELLGLKRKALGLRREGKIEEAEEVLRSAKALEAEIAELEAPKTEALSESNRPMTDIIKPPSNSAEDEEPVDFTENDMHDPARLSILQNIGWKDKEHETQNVQGVSFQSVSTSPVNSSVASDVSRISAAAQRSNGEIHRELLGLKRNALALRRKGENEEAEVLLKKAKILEAQLEDLEGTQKGSTPEPSADKKPVISESLIIHEKKGTSEISPSRSSGLILVPSQQMEDINLLLGETSMGAHGVLGNAGRSQGPFSPPTQSSSTVDLLKGDVPGTNRMPPNEQGEKYSTSIGASHLPNHFHEISKGKKIDVNPVSDVPPLQHDKSGERVYAPMRPSTNETSFAKQLASHNGQNIQNEVLAQKKKAVALKREGKLSAALEELRKAKLLEKSIENDMSAPNSVTMVGVSMSMADTPVPEKEFAAGKVASKPVSGRDRFKLQQESLSHKRQALKLRREGKMVEAEAEFELAKSLEAQLEETSSQDTSKSSLTAGAADEVTVEDLLDPQLLLALRAIGIEDTNIPAQVPQKPEPVKSTPIKIDNVMEEKSQLEGRIKAEKLKAVNLKRQGKQAEALDALRRAKLYEKKLNSLESN